MLPVKADPAKVKTFENAIAFDRWLSEYHQNWVCAERPMPPCIFQRSA